MDNKEGIGGGVEIPSFAQLYYEQRETNKQIWKQVHFLQEMVDRMWFQMTTCENPIQKVEFVLDQPKTEGRE